MCFQYKNNLTLTYMYKHEKYVTYIRMNIEISGIVTRLLLSTLRKITEIHLKKILIFIDLLIYTSNKLRRKSIRIYPYNVRNLYKSVVEWIRIYIYISEGYYKNIFSAETTEC